MPSPSLSDIVKFDLNKELSMKTILFVVGILLGLLVLYFLGIQFYKIGKILKQKAPILFRVYIICWVIIGGGIAILTVGSVYTSIEQKEEQAKREKKDADINAIVSKYNDSSREDIEKLFKETEARGFYLTNNEQFYLLLLKKSTIPAIKEVKAKGYTLEDIANYYGIYTTDTNPVATNAIQAARKVNLDDQTIFLRLKESGLVDNEIKQGLTDKEIADNYNLNISH